MLSISCRAANSAGWADGVRRSTSWNVFRGSARTWPTAVAQPLLGQRGAADVALAGQVDPQAQHQQHHQDARDVGPAQVEAGPGLGGGVVVVVAAAVV